MWLLVSASEGLQFIFYIPDDFGFEFARPEFYHYLNQTGVYTVDGTNDAHDYNDLRVNVVKRMQFCYFKMAPYSFMTARALMMRASVICARSRENVDFSLYFVTSA